MPQLIGQTASAQIEDAEIVQTETGQLTTENEIVQPVAGQFVQSQIAQMPNFVKLTSYSNHVQILNFCNSHEHRLFYILYANRERLNKRELQRCISNDTFSNLLSKKKKMTPALLESYPQAPIMFKEADLLFFHRGLQCLVAIELKKKKFHPRDLGQLEFYLEALDRDVKRSNENPSIGIILCPEADEKVVEYAMSRSMSPAMIAEYKRMLIPKEKMQMLLREYCSFIACQK